MWLWCLCQCEWWPLVPKTYSGCVWFVHMIMHEISTHEWVHVCTSVDSEVLWGTNSLRIDSVLKIRVCAVSPTSQILIFKIMNDCPMLCYSQMHFHKSQMLHVICKCTLQSKATDRHFKIDLCYLCVNQKHFWANNLYWIHTFTSKGNYRLEKKMSQIVSGKNITGSWEAELHKNIDN